MIKCNWYWNTKEWTWGITKFNDYNLVVSGVIIERRRLLFFEIGPLMITWKRYINGESYMPNNNKRRGDVLEYEVRDAFLAHGFNAERARGSDGKSLGLRSEVDVAVWDIAMPVSPGILTIQCKRRKELADYLTSEECNIVATRKDGKGAKRLYVIPEDVLFELLKGGR